MLSFNWPPLLRTFLPQGASGWYAAWCVFGSLVIYQWEDVIIVLRASSVTNSSSLYSRDEAAHTGRIRYCIRFSYAHADGVWLDVTWVLDLKRKSSPWCGIAAFMSCMKLGKVVTLVALSVERMGW